MEGKLKEIMICGTVHTIKYVSVLDSWGQIDHEKCEIKIRKDLNPQCQDQVLIEEILHGILVRTGFQGKHNETLLQSISNGLYQAGIRTDSFNGN